MTTAQRILYFLALGLHLHRKQEFYGRVLPAERRLA